MGYSADAMLHYGIVFEGENNIDFMYEWLRENISSKILIEDDEDDILDDLDTEKQFDYYCLLQNTEEPITLDQLDNMKLEMGNLDLDYVGHYDFSQCILYHNDSKQWTCDYEPEPINVSIYAPDNIAKWESELKEFCVKYNIPFEPKMYLSARYG